MLFLHLTRFVLIALCVTHFTTLDFKAQAQTGSSLLPTSSQQRIAESKITDASIRADVEFLADDLLEGRGPGTRGDRLAQKYIISQFKQMGLKPAGNDGQWTQEVPLMGVTTRPPSTLTFERSTQSLSLKNNDDYIVTCGTGVEQAVIKDAEVIFVGYGIQAPEYGWNDFKGIDVKGKILLCLNNDPADNPEIFAGRTTLLRTLGLQVRQSGRVRRGRDVDHSHDSLRRLSLSSSANFMDG